MVVHLSTGLGSEQKQAFRVSTFQAYHYLSSNSDPMERTLCLNRWNDLQEAFRMVGFKEGDYADINSILVGILHLGNIQFNQNDNESASIEDRAQLELACSSLLVSRTLVSGMLPH